MSLSAAELQKRHGLEGAPDPFPSLGGEPQASVAAAKPKSNGTSSIDTSSESAFPSLGSSSSTSAPAITKPVSSMWSTKATAASKIAKSPATGLASKAGGLGRAGASGPTASSHPFTDSFSVPANDVASGKQLSETIAKVQKETGVLVESSSQMRTGLKTFHLRGQDQKRLDKAKALIQRGISKTVTIQVEVPISTFGTIIGPKGATLKSITEATGCKIDIPRRETLPTADSTAVSSAEADTDSDDDEPEDPSAAITITGPSVSAADARTRIEDLIFHKVSQTAVSIKHIPSHLYPFIAGPKGIKARLLEEELGEADINITIPTPAVWKALERQANGEQGEYVTESGKSKKDLAIRVRGEKTKVQKVVDEINKQYENLLDNLSELSISLPKRQHRFLVGHAADEVLEQTGCIIELPRIDDPSDKITIRGPQLALGTALQLAIEKANQISVETVDVANLHRGVPNPSDHAKQILHFLLRTNRLRAIAENHDDVKVFPPFAAVVDATGQVVIEVVGEDKAQVEKAKAAVIAAIKEITPAAIETLEIDFSLHKFLIGKKGSKIAQFESANKVTTVFPPAAEESSTVTLIYTGPLDAFGPAGKERDSKVKEVLKAAKVELENLAKDAADVKSETLNIDQKWHKAIIGPGGAILNALIGDDQIVNVRVGAGPRGQSSGEDANVVVVRGPSGEVDRIVKEIKQIVEDAENDNIVNGYTVEFNVDKKHVPHLVGSSGAAINKLREEFGVKVNFDDDEGKKSSKSVARCTIVGRKELVEKAKERVLEQIERLADETTETVNIKRALQPALIGAGGKYAIRLEEKYGVKLSFPRENKDGTAPSKPDEVVIRGGKKGVAQAKAELLEAAAFESETRQSATFTVPTKSVSMIVGKAGATINAIKDDTGAKIDIDKNAGSDEKTTVTVSGDKKAIAAAKAAVLAVVEQVGDELTTTLTIEPKFHRTLIGQGGQKLRELVAACGGPEEAFKQNGLINFPRQGDANTDQVRLRGDRALVTKIKAELEKQVKILRETKVLGVVVPVATHASRIGRGGAALQDLQKKTGAIVHFPGSRSYKSVGEIENPEDVKDADPKDIVKVIGTEEATSKAIEQLSIVSEQPARNGPRGGGGRSGGNDYPTRTVSIPAKYRHALVEGGSLVRSIRSVGGVLVQPQGSQPKPTISRPSVVEGAKEARIDAADEGADLEYGWELKANYEGLGDEEEEWVVRAKEESLDKAVNILNQAVEKAKQATHVGALVGLPRSAFPRIIGSKGATISRLRAETGADIHVGQDDDLITITGDKTSVEQAKDAIISIVSRSGGNRY